MVSTQPIPPDPQDQEHAPLSSLPQEADPSGFTERAPALVSLLPDEALSLALARSDAFAMHAALTARLAREPAGPVRDTLQELLRNRALFVRAERPPSLRSFLGSGTRLVSLPARSEQQTPFIATRALCLLGLPLWALGDHLVRRDPDGRLAVLGHVAGASRRSGVSRWVSALVLGGLGLAVAGALVPPFVIREVRIVNGFSRPVEVRLDDQSRIVEPGQIVEESLFSLGRPYHVVAAVPGSLLPLETLSLEANQRSVYNILGAASVQIADAEKGSGPSELESRTGLLEEEQQLRWRGGWKQRLLEHERAERWQDAATLARAAFLVDPSQLQAAETAANILARTQPAEALAFAQTLARRSPDELAVHRLAQDLFLALGRRAEAYAIYQASARQQPESARRALLEARVTPPELQSEAYALVRKRFSGTPEAVRLAVRTFLAEGRWREAGLLDKAQSMSPESVEDLELRVRAMLANQEFQEASEAVREYAAQPGHTSWELAVLAGRLARVTGPQRLESEARKLIPPALLGSPKHLALFDLLTGGGTISKKQLSAIQDPSAREAIALTQAFVQDHDKAQQQARGASDQVVRHLDPEMAALFALEFSRLGEAKNADRFFGASLSLMAAREPLELYLRQGEKRTDFLMLPPGLQAAAILERSRISVEYRFAALREASSIDGLGGLARRVLDPSYNSRPDREDLRPPPPVTHEHRFKPFCVHMIRGSDFGHVFAPLPDPPQ